MGKEQMYIAMIVGLVLICTVLLIRLLRNRQRIRNMTESIDTFLLGGEAMPISTEDSDLGHLETNIYELQNRILQERDFIGKEAENNREFISDISHQLKTPLAALRLYCEMDADSSHGDKQLALIDKMEQLIQNVLTLEKLRSDTYEMHFVPCTLTEIAEAVVRELQPLFPHKQITVTGNGQMRADSEWMHEALGNVVKNACEHTQDDGMVDITIQQGENSVNLAVADNGGGVKPEELSKLFVRFHRTENAVPTSTGIGLAITKAVVDKHHGIISAHNTVSGLCVTMCLPIIDGNLKI